MNIIFIFIFIFINHYCTLLNYLHLKKIQPVLVYELSNLHFLISTPFFFMVYPYAYKVKKSQSLQHAFKITFSQHDFKIKLQHAFKNHKH